ncbi:MAG: hypothetical protein NDJ94_02350 [Vicinamibacteria bacterium]|nr:hypothetical protein [Vicinamibacteria bacterium]
MLTVLLMPLWLAQATDPSSAAVAEHLRGLRGEVAGLHATVARQGELLTALAAALEDQRRLLADRATPEATAADPALAFLAGAPAASDSAGVARAVVFEPRIVSDQPRRHDLVTLRLRRVEAQRSATLAELDLGGDQAAGVALPLDRNGALYVVEWATSEGQTFSLVLRDGLTGATAAQVKVTAAQARGAFVFVGYRLD